MALYNKTNQTLEMFQMFMISALIAILTLNIILALVLGILVRKQDSACLLYTSNKQSPRTFRCGGLFLFFGMVGSFRTGVFLCHLKVSFGHFPFFQNLRAVGFAY